MQAVLKRAARFATSDAPVVVLGETGSGKEIVARILHANSSRALALGPEIREEELPDELARVPGSGTRTPPPTPSTLRSLAEVERDHLLLVLDACGGSQPEAARVLGIARNTLWRNLRSYGT